MRSLILSLGLLTTLGYSPISAAEDTAKQEKKDPIDLALDKAIDKDPSTAGMVQATAEANKKWIKDIETTLSKLKKAMAPEAWTALEASQKNWETWRDSEIKTQQEIYSRKEGTMWRPVSASAVMELNKQRAVLLRGYLTDIVEG